MKYWGILLVVGWLNLPAHGQQLPPSGPSDSLSTVRDPATDTLTSYASKRFNPRKALLYSAIFPGLGQIYNKKYWKAPLVYGGFATTIGISMFYDEQYQRFRDELFETLEEGSTTSARGFTQTQLRSGIDRARRERDFFIILSGFWYILQMVDAHVDAHLKEFDLNPKLNVSLEPKMDGNVMTGRTTGVALVFRF